MGASEETRKPIDQLTAEDLKAFPVCEFAIDEEDVEGRDETWVRPLNVGQILRDAWSLSVASDFISPNGNKFEGIMEVTTAIDSPCSSACLIVGGAYMYIDGAPGSRERQAISKALGGTEAELFPMKYTLRVLVEGESTCRTGNVV
jgi:hypothetical protein